MKRALIAAVIVATASTAWAQGRSAAPAPAPKPATPAPKAAAPAAPATKPAEFKVTFDTTKGPVVLAIHREWSPNGVDRFYNLVKNGFYDEVRFFRVIPNFMAQFGINGDPAVTSAWQKVVLKDDPVTQSNK